MYYLFFSWLVAGCWLLKSFIYAALVNFYRLRLGGSGGYLLKAEMGLVAIYSGSVRVRADFFMVRSLYV